MARYVLFAVLIEEDSSMPEVVHTVTQALDDETVVSLSGVEIDPEDILDASCMIDDEEWEAFINERLKSDD